MTGGSLRWLERLAYTEDVGVLRFVHLQGRTLLNTPPSPSLARGREAGKIVARNRGSMCPIRSVSRL
jgi:hypothetical protein